MTIASTARIGSTNQHKAVGGTSGSTQLTGGLRVLSRVGIKEEAALLSSLAALKGELDDGRGTSLSAGIEAAVHSDVSNVETLPTQAKYEMSDPPNPQLSLSIYTAQEGKTAKAEENPTVETASNPMPDSNENPTKELFGSHGKDNEHVARSAAFLAHMRTTDTSLDEVIQAASQFGMVYRVEPEEWNGKSVFNVLIMTPGGKAEQLKIQGRRSPLGESTPLAGGMHLLSNGAFSEDATLLKNLKEMKLSLDSGKGISLAKGIELAVKGDHKKTLPTQAKYEMTDPPNSALSLSIYTAQKGEKTKPEENPTVETARSPLAGATDVPVREEFGANQQDDEHVARSAAFLAHMQTTDASLQQVIKAASVYGMVYRVEPEEWQGKAVFNVLVLAPDGHARQLKIDLQRHHHSH